jgi:hypothetical protein
MIQLSATTCVVIACLSVATVGCKRRTRPAAPAAAASASFLADTGFRPPANGYAFNNQGGQYPKTPPVLTGGGVVKLFGANACLGGDVANCKLTPAAGEWMAMINRAMNGGQCEGMAVSSLVFFEKDMKPSSLVPRASSTHNLTHDQAFALIGYFWAWQAVNPVRALTLKSRATQTPSSAEDTLVEMMKRHELATVSIRFNNEGHAVTPYAVEDRGNNIHWIRIYDNNWPDKERYIIIDRTANTWKYELASINPDVPRLPWSGTADTHSIAITPLSARLGAAECPFCSGGTRKVVTASGGNSVTLTNQDGKKLGIEDGKLVNEIPEAEVVTLNSYLDGAPVGEPMYVVPAEGDYDVHIAGTDHRAGGSEGDHGVSIIGNGSAVAVETARLRPGERDTLSLHRDGAVRYASGSGGTIPPIRMAHDGDGKHGMQVRIANMKADAHEALELRMDHKAGEITVQGGGRKSESYDLKVKHVHAGAEDHEVEQRGIKYSSGAVHTVHSDPSPGAKHTAVSVKSAPRPKEPPAKSTPAKRK